MEISIDIFLSIEDIDDILLLFSKTSVEKFHQYFASISKMSMEISIDILLLSVNQIWICKVFSQIFSGNKFTKN